MQRLFTAKTIFTLIILGSLSLLGWAALRWFSEKSALQSQMEALRADGLPTNLPELGTFYSVPDGVTDTTEIWAKVFDVVGDANVAQRGQSLPFIGTGPTPIPGPGENWPEFATAKELLGELETEFELIRAAGATQGQYRWPGQHTFNFQRTDLNQAREVVRLLVLDAYVAAHSEDPERVLNDILAIFSLRDALNGEVTMIAQLVRNAIHSQGTNTAAELLPHVDWNDSQLERLQTALLTTDFRESLIKGLQGERALSFEAAKQFPLFLNSNRLNILKLYKRSLESLDVSLTRAIEEHRQLKKEYDATVSNGLIQKPAEVARMMQPTLLPYVLSGARAQTQQMCLVTMIAAQRHRLRHGELPRTLTEIDDDLLETSRADFSDPFDGQPLRLKRTDGEFFIYSIGRNQIDDGGNFEVDPQTHEGFDWGMTLPRQAKAADTDSPPSGN